MTTNSSEPREALTPGVREDQAADGSRSASTVAQDMSPSDVDAFAELWAEAKVYFLARVFPRYGSRAWCELLPDDPRRLASVFHAAEMWRKYGDEDNLLAWFRDANRSRPPYADGRTRAELDEAAKPKPAHQLRATPGWPPIRIPGQPGRYLRYVQERRAA